MYGTIRHTLWTCIILVATLALLLPAPGARAMNHGVARAYKASSTRWNAPPWKGLPAKVRSVLNRQIPLLNAAHGVERLIGNSQNAQFGGVAIDIPTNQVLVFWKGETRPKILLKYLAGLSVRYSIRSVKYSQAELDAAKQAAVRTGVIARAVTMPDHSGIEAVPKPGRRPQLSRIDDVPITITGQKASEATDCTPTAPCPPYQGGTNILVDVGAEYYNVCTSSWRVIDSNDNDGLLTVAHCGLIGDTWAATGHVYSAPGDEVATSIPKHAFDIDAMIITGKSPYYGGFYDDAWNTSSEWSVTTYKEPIAGQKVCTMGSLSGGDCDWTLDDPACDLTYGGNFQDVRGFCTSENSGEYAIGKGDSGAPFYYPGDGVWDTYAVGMQVAATDVTHPCWTKSKPDRGNVCANNAFGIPLSRILDEFNLGLLTT